LLAQTEVLKPKENFKQILSIQEVSEYIGYKACSIYGLINRKSIPYFKMGRLVRFEKTKIDEWILSSRRTTIKEISADADLYLSKKRKV
jgi:excisionase family DNA binding protein